MKSSSIKMGRKMKTKTSSSPPHPSVALTTIMALIVMAAQPGTYCSGNTITTSAGTFMHRTRSMSLMGQGMATAATGTRATGTSLDLLLQVRGGSSSSPSSSESESGLDEDENEGEVSSYQEQQNEEEEVVDIESTQPPPATTTETPPSSVNTSTSTAVKPSASTSTSASVTMNPKVQNAIERTGPACIMLFLLYLLIKFTGENGLFMIIPMMQFGMYKETTGIIEEYYNKNGEVNNNSNNQRRNNFDLEMNIEKWWWFATVFASTSGRMLLQNYSNSYSSSGILSFLNNKDLVNLLCFGMVAVGLVMSVVGMASHVDASADRFRSYLGEVASFHFALVR